MESQRSSSLVDSPEQRERARQISLLVYEFLSKKNKGEPIEPVEYESAHPELMPELRTALRRGIASLRNVLDAERAHQGQIDEAGNDPAMSGESFLATDNHPRVRGYRLIREISGGGQGAVYEAVHEITGRAVALKVITAISKNSAARFEREALALATVSDPGLVGIIDRGRTATGSYYLTMDYVEGHDLDDWLSIYRRSTSPTQKQVLRVFADIATAIGAAHEKGVVHRDLKPSNIRIDRHGRPKVVDFGLAHLMEQNDPAPRELTMTGNIVGSIPWASPEQAEGVRGKLSPASDVYSLGVLMFHALSGEFPYDVAAPLHTVTYNICKKAPADPSNVANPKFGAVDRALGSIILKCLAKRVEDRYDTGAALSRALTSYLNGTLPEPPRRLRTRGWPIAIAVFLAIAASFGIWHHFHLPTPAAEVLVAPLPRFTNSIGMSFVEVPKGMFRMGSPISEVGHKDEEQAHTVHITRAFYIESTEVTRKQYRQVMGILPHGIGSGGDELPVDHVSWDDANTFCQKLSTLDGRSYNLPTEAQWEYACRAGSSRPFGGTGDATSMSWCSQNSDGHLHPVANRSPNHWGLYDMHGNAAEWVLDCFVPYLGSAYLRDPIHIMSNSMGTVRGGSFLEPALNCRAAARMARSRAIAATGLGFRVIMTPALPAAGT